MSVPNRFAVGLGLIDAIAGLDAKSVKLQSRVGIVTGLVVVGDLIGEGSAREQSIVDETPDLSVSLRSCLSQCPSAAVAYRPASRSYPLSPRSSLGLACCPGPAHSDRSLMSTATASYAPSGPTAVKVTPNQTHVRVARSCG
jgi:hypothetical protein